MKKSIKQMQSSSLELLSVRFLSNQKLLILLAALMASVSTYAYDFEVNGIYYNKLSSTDVSVTNGSSRYTGNITIPSTVSYNSTSFSVTSIDNQAFINCSNLIKVTIPDSVTSIGDQAFALCGSLISVTLPNSITSVGEGAFFRCSNLASVTIPSSVTSISEGTFMGCTSLTSAIIPNSVTSIGVRAFYNTALFNDNSNWENGSLYIGNHLICTKSDQIHGDYTIKNGTLTLARLAFDGCSSLESVYIPYSVRSICGEVFRGCTGLTSVTIKNSEPSDISLGENIFLNSSFSTATLYVPSGSKELYAAADQWKEFGTIEEFQTVVNLVDGQSYSETSDIQNIDITYTRTFTPDIWQPLYVPFNMSYDEWKDYGRVAELSCVHAYEDGRTTIEFVTVTSGELLPNVPYVILPSVSGEVTFTCTNKTLKAAPEEGSKYIMCCSPRYTFKIYGNYQPISGSTLKTYGDPQFGGAYVMTTDNKFKHCSTTATLKPYRFYFTKEKTANGYWNAPARQNAAVENEEDDVIYLMVDGEVCGIADVVIDDDANGKVFDLMGREVKNPSNGIYIQNGKKTRIY